MKPRKVSSNNIEKMDYYKPLLTFVLLLIIFHLLLIKYFPQSKIFWKKVDYFWISIGVIGIIGATFSLRKEYGTAIKPWHTESLNSVYNQYINDLQQQNNYFLGMPGFDYESFENKIEAEKFKQAGNVFASLSKLAIKHKDKILNDENYMYIDSIKIPYEKFLDTIDNEHIISSSSSATFMLNRIQEERIALNDSNEKTNRNEFNWLLLFISPYLFATAIAIRLTKVTAELNEIK